MNGQINSISDSNLFIFFNGEIYTLSITPNVFKVRKNQISNTLLSFEVLNLDSNYVNGLYNLTYLYTDGQSNTYFPENSLSTYLLKNVISNNNSYAFISAINQSTGAGVLDCSLSPTPRLIKNNDPTYVSLWKFRKFNVPLDPNTCK